jgi:autotransporter translocation and assembly factor TamB
MRIVRRLVHALVIVVALVIGAAAAAVIVSQTAWFKNWLRGYIVAQANQYLNGTLTIGGLKGNLFFGIEMEDVGVSMEGRPAVAVKDIGLNYNAIDVLTKGLSIDSIRIDKPVVYLRREGETWSLSRLVKKQEEEANREGPARPVTIQEIGISDGTFEVEGPVGTGGVDVPKRFDHLDAKLSFKYDPVHYSIEISQVSFRGSEPAIALNALSGGIAVYGDAVHVERLSLRTAETSLSANGAVQNYLTKPNLNLEISADKLSVPEIARLVPALAGVRLQPQMRVKLDGPLDRLGVDLNVQSQAGALAGRLTADLEAPGQVVRGTLSVRHLDLAPILNDPKQKSDITGDARFDLRAADVSNLDTFRGSLALQSSRSVAAGYAAGPFDVKARIEGRRIGLDARASAYGASATANGTVTLPGTTAAEKAEPVAFDVKGQLRRVDLRKMPRDLEIPAADTNVNADYHVVGSVSQDRTSDTRVRPVSTRGSAPVANGGEPRPALGSHGAASRARPVATRGSVAAADGRSRLNVKGDMRFLESAIAGAEIVDGSTAAVAIDGNDISYSADATVAHVDLQRIGRAFNVPALAADRYAGTINGHVVARGRGTDPREMEVTAGGTLNDTSILGGRIPELQFDAQLAQDAAHVKAAGTIADLDPALASGRADMKGRVGGRVDVDATVAGLSRGVTPDAVEARVDVALDPSTVGGLEIASARIDADYRNSSGEIRTLEVTGADVHVQAKGTLALTEDGQSNLQVHADSSSLDRLGKLVNQPLTGIASVDATVTGNRRELQATGSLSADGLKYGENGALTIASDFSASIPELRAADARGSATTHATFVTVGGFNVNEIDATTSYDQKTIEFDANAREPQRSLAAAGTLAMHPDHQEVHLRSLGLTSRGVQWQTAGGDAAIQYAGDAVTVKDLRLVNGDQEITAEGTFGRPGDALHVTARNIDIATVDALMLREPQLSGRLNATSTISGTKEAPDVEAEFKIEQGGFRQFRYDAFGGTVAYRGQGLTVDARLEQNPTTWLAAKGYLPLALFKPQTAESRAAAHGAEVDPADRIDFHVDSSPIDIGLVQGFTTSLKDVTGTLQAKLDVAGSAADPHAEGLVTVENGTFTVVPTGVTYSNLGGRIEFQPDRVHIGAITVLDNHDNPLNISGDLAVHARELGSVQIYVNADDFKIIDNKMGNVRIFSSLALSGELRAPRVEGDLGVTTGRINLDPILASVGESAYATEPTQVPAGTADETGGQPGVMGALQMDVRLTVPDDLVVKASDLKAPGAVIGLGAMLVTLGGDVRAQKDPGQSVRLRGVVNTVRGFYDFQGRRFTILRDGTVRFEGYEQIDPSLDLRAEREIQAVTANVRVRGTLTKPEIELSSVPPLEQADILALIVFNQPLNTLGEGEQVSLAQRAQALAIGSAAGGLAKSIGSALNLNEFDINLAPADGSGGNVTVGQQVGQNLYVRLQQGIGDLGTTNVILEYELTKWLRFRSNVFQGSSAQRQLFQRIQGSGADMLFFFSY